MDRAKLSGRRIGKALIRRLSWSRRQERRPAGGTVSGGTRRIATDRPDGFELKLLAAPHPFRAMLAISTDIDHTSAKTFRETHRFMNTHEPTEMGEGVGLDIANSMWFYRKDPKSVEGPAGVTSDVAAPQGRHEVVSYFAGSDWRTRSESAEELMHYVRAGWIDTLHSYGDFSQASKTGRYCTRAHAERAFQALEDEGVRLPVWVNHGREENRQNIGDADYMEGALPRSEAYHADLLAAAGTRYYSGHLGSYTSEASWLDPLEPLALQDRTTVWAFRRAARIEGVEGATRIGRRFGVPFSTKGGRNLVWVWHPRALHLQLAQSRLELIAEQGGYTVLAQHLGSASNLTRFGPEAADSFRRLRRFQDDGMILTSSTSRMLDFVRAQQGLVVDARLGDGQATIDLVAIDDSIMGRSDVTLEMVRGITFRADGVRGIRLSIAGREIPEKDLVRASIAGGGEIIGIRWHEADVEDHTRPFTQADRSNASTASREARTLDTIGFCDRSSAEVLVVSDQPAWGDALSDANRNARITRCEADELDSVRGAEFKLGVIDAGACGPSPRSSLVRIAASMRPGGSCYAVVPGPNADAQRAIAAERDGDDAARAEALERVAGTFLLRSGVRLDPKSPVAGEYESFVETIIQSGFRFIAEPGCAASRDVVEGFEPSRDVLFERLSDEKKKYRRIDIVDELADVWSQNAAWYEELRRLVRLDLPEVVLEVLKRHERKLGGARAYRTVLGGALAKAGHWDHPGWESVLETARQALESSKRVPGDELLGVALAGWHLAADDAAEAFTVASTAMERQADDDETKHGLAFLREVALLKKDPEHCPELATWPMPWRFATCAAAITFGGPAARMLTLSDLPGGDVTSTPPREAAHGV